MPPRLLRRAFTNLMVAACMSATTSAQQAPPPRVLVIESMYGPDVFRFYCASCHGADGHGRGPVAAALKAPPPDLTTLRSRHNGVFPRVETERILEGQRTIAAHGSADMPVWGPIFRALGDSDAQAKMRIKNVIDYLERLQK